MSNKSYKWQRLAIVLAMVSLCCFVFAGAALAASPSLTVSQDKFCAGEETTFDLTVKDIDIDINCDLCGHAGGNNIEVFLPYLDGVCRQWDIRVDDMDLIPVDILVRHPDGSKEWVTSTVEPMDKVVDEANNTVSAKLYVQCANLDVPQNSYAEEVVIRDFAITTPKRSNDQCYECKVVFNGTDPLISARWCLTVYDTIKNVVIDTPAITIGETSTPGLTVTAGKGFAVTGWVFDLCDKGIADVPVTISVDGKDVVVYTSGANDRKGYFEATINAPECIEDCTNIYTVSATASEVEDRICGSAKAETQINVIGDTPVGITWRDMPDENPDPELTRDEIYLNTCYELDLNLHDNLCPNGHGDMVCPGNPAQASEQVKVELLALQKDSNGVQQIAGYFYGSESDCIAGQNPIAYVTIDELDCDTTVWFKPVTYYGEINVIARAKYWNDKTADNLADCTWTPYVVSDQAPFELVYTPLVYDNRCADEQRSGWPFQMAVWANNCADCDEFDVKVELAAENGTAMWSTELIKAYDVIGSGLYADVLKGDYQTYEHKATSAAQGLDHPCKSHFYVYTTPGTTSVDVRVKLICKEDGMTWIEDYEDIDLTTPVELRRALRSEAWQVLSTPKYIAKPGVPFNPANSDSYGTFEDLLDEDIYSVIYTYDTYEPTKWVQVEATDKVEPLKAYFVKTRQFDLDDERAVVEYVFARATTPDATIPAVRSIDRSWNALGVAVQDNDHLPLLDDNGYCNPWLQGDSPYRALGTVGKGSKLIYNPEAMGNIVDGDWNTLTVSQDTLGSWVIDPVAGLLLEDLMFYNGDGYWIYMTNKQELAANVGLEIFGNYTGGGIN